jgi:hypothetical protein
MLSEKQFRERARSELRSLGDQLKAAASDRDIYWKLEREIVAHNPQLKNGRSAFLDMLRGCYVDATTARVLRLLEPGETEVSLPGILEQLAIYPELLHGKLTQAEFADDRRARQRAVVNIRRAIVPHAAHHERTLPALASAHRELDAAIDLMISQIKTYYWIITDGYLDLDITHVEDPNAVFRSAWAVPALAAEER